MLRAVLIELLRQLNSIRVKRVSRTKIMKLLYLIDRECKSLYGDSCTKTKWILWWHGPFSRSVLDVLDELEISGIVDADVVDYGDYVAVEYTLINPDYRVHVDNRTKDMIKKVVEKWGKRDLKRILKHVYSLPEVQKASLGDEL